MKNNSDLTRAALYLRKSRMDPDSESINETLSRHTDTLLKLSAKMNLDIIEIYKEIVSGDGLFTRPEMCRLLRDIEQNKYDAVVCMAIDRLGRSSQKDGGIILETFQEHGVMIITPNKTYNLDDEIDEQSVEMQTFIARQELKSIKRRLRRGVEKSVEAGCHVSEPPYGYRRVFINKMPTLEICEEEAKVIRLVFDMYVNQGLGSSIIADTINCMGYRTRRDNYFSRNTVRFFLQNRTYAGKIIWNKHKHIKKKLPEDKHKSVINPEEKWIVADGIHPAIISGELFDAAQRIRTSRSHPPVLPRQLHNPFAGLIYCKNCGKALQRQVSSNSVSRLLCTVKGCNASIRTEYVEKQITNFLYLLLSDYDYIPDYYVQNKNNRRSEIIRDAIQDLKKHLHNLSIQKSRLHDLLEQGIYDTNTFLERSRILSDKISAAESSLRENEKILSKTEQILPSNNDALTLKKLLTCYDRLSAAEKNKLLRLIIKKMYYTHTKEQGKTEYTLEIELNDNL